LADLLAQASNQTIFDSCSDTYNEDRALTSIAASATLKIVQLLTAPGGLNATISAMAQEATVSLQPVAAKQFFTNNVASEIAEKSGEVKYTAVYVYCDKIANTLTEKFRSFSGHLQMAIEVRVSQDRLDGVEQSAQLYTESVTQTLNQIRGNWGQGLFYAGTYDVSFGPVKHGGKNFVKTVKITFPVEASIS